MFELNNKRMCSFCFSVIRPGTNECPSCGKVHREQSIPEVLPCGTILHGRYVIGRSLGKGGFSVTYLAYDSRKDNIIAIKEFFPSGFAKRDADGIHVKVMPGKDLDFFKQNMKHFYEEAQILSMLKHPNIVDIFNLYSENGTVYYTMEYLRGNDLRHRLAYSGGTITEQELIPIVACVAEALDTVHSMGLLHRDIAPDNIFITNDGTVKLIDFGAAKDIGKNRLASFSIILKQGFAPLEQYQRKGNQGPWTDIYALGATMFFCLNGTMPMFPADRMRDPKISVKCSKPMEQVIDKMMKVRPENRCRSIKEFKSMFLNAVNAAPSVLGVVSESQALSNSDDIIAANDVPMDDVTTMSVNPSMDRSLSSGTPQAETSSKPEGIIGFLKTLTLPIRILSVITIVLLLIIIIVILLNM